MKHRTYKQFKKVLLRDKAVRRPYEELRPEFYVIEMIIRKRIREGLSQQELANKIGTKQSAISRFESGNYNPTLSFLQKMAEALNARLKISIR